MTLEPPASDRLDSWKEIAAYLGRTEKTAQRWEQSEGLPVYRLAHQERGSVYAYRSEINAWREARRVRSEPAVAAFPASRPATRARLWLAVTGGLLVAASALTLALWPSKPPSTPTVAVLPFTNVSNDG